MPNTIFYFSRNPT